MAVPLQAEADRREDVVAIAGRAGGGFAIAERACRQGVGSRAIGPLRQARGRYEAMEGDERHLLLGLRGRGLGH
jgi:hypothetical protein